jgi:hypothetical protein
VRVIGPFEEAEGKDEPQLARQSREAGDDRIAGGGTGEGEEAGQLVLAEIGRLEQLLQEDDLRSLGRGPADQRLGLVQIAGGIAAAGELGGGEGNTAAAGAGDRLNEPSAARNRGGWGRGSSSRPTTRRETA